MPQADYFLELEYTGNINNDLRSFLEKNSMKTWKHVRTVADKGLELADRFGASLEATETGCLAHDLAYVVPLDEMISACETWDVPLSETDRKITTILHGPLAAAVIHKRLHVKNTEILDAIRYHTTLRSNSTLLDKIVFLADKIALDPETRFSDFLPTVKKRLETSLEAAIYAYMDYCITRKDELGWILHPNLMAAFRELGRNLEISQ